MMLDLPQPFGADHLTNCPGGRRRWDRRKGFETGEFELGQAHGVRIRRAHDAIDSRAFSGVV